MKNVNNMLPELVINKYLPHAILAERLVLGNILVNSDSLEMTIRYLTINAFYFKPHQQIYNTILTLQQNSTNVDVSTVISLLHDEGLLEQIGGVDFLRQLIQQASDFSNLIDYINLIQDKYIRRCLIKLGYQTINSAYISNITLDHILSELDDAYINFIQYKKSNNIMSSSQLFSNIFVELKERAYQKTFPGLASGFYDLDSITQGFQKSDLIIVAGRPSMGKTAFCLNIAINIIKKYQLPIIFFSLEMSKEQLVYRLLANSTQISNTRLRSGNLTKTDWKTIIKTIKLFSSLPLFIDDTTNLTVNDIRTKIKKIMFERKHVGLIIIDYLQLMQCSTNKSENRVQELSQITRMLKNIGREFNVPIIVLSQLSRSVETRTNKQPILSDLRESGSIEQDSDLVLMLYNQNYYNQDKSNTTYITDIIIAKHRNGPVGKVSLTFNPIYTQFSNIESN
tara:strand:- start:90 stop:1448 length:1359 start_codon:yes stop_codon:yes gene_type:complete